MRWCSKSVVYIKEERLMQLYVLVSRSDLGRLLQYALFLQFLCAWKNFLCAWKV